MCQSVAEGGRRCPAHRYDTRAILKRAVGYERRPGYSMKLYHDVFVDLRRAYRGTKMDDEQYVAASGAIADVIESEVRDAHPVDPATLQAQMQLMSPLKIIPDEVEAKIISHLAGAKTKDSSYDVDPITLFNYVYENPSLFPQPTNQELHNARVDLGDTPLARVPSAVATYAVIRSGYLLDPVDSSPTDTTIRPRITELTPITNRAGSPINAAGYAPATLGNTSRLEVTLQDDFNTKLTYKNVSPEQWQAIQAGGTQARDALTEIRLNPESQYASKAESEKAAYTDDEGNGHERCLDCGQFKDQTDGHACPQRTVKLDIINHMRDYWVYRSRLEPRNMNHMDQDGTPWETSGVELPDLTPATPLPIPQGSEERSIPTLEQLEEQTGTTLLVPKHRKRHTKIATVGELAHPILMQFKVQGSVPANAQYDDKIIYMDEPGPEGDRQETLNTFIAYLPQDSSLTILDTDDGIFVQRTGIHIDRWNEYDSIGFEQISRAGPIKEVTLTSPFPSLYELTNSHRKGIEPVSPSTQDTWRLPDAESIREAFQRSPTVNMVLRHKMVVNAQGRFIDQDGQAYEPLRPDYDEPVKTTHVREIEVNVSLEESTDGEVRILGIAERRCSDCYSSACSHQSYTLRQVNQILQHHLGVREESKVTSLELPTSLKNHCTVTDDLETGSKTLVLNGGQQSHRFIGRFTSEEDNNEERYLYNNISVAPHPTQIARALRYISPGDSVTVPFLVSFTELSRSPFETYSRSGVQGSITYTKDEDGKIITRERKLKCNCDVYQHNYSCRHTRRVEEREQALLQPLRNQSGRLETTDEVLDQQRAFRIQDRTEVLQEEIPTEEEALQISNQELLMSYEALSEIENQYNATMQAAKLEKQRREDLETTAAYSAQHAKMAERFNTFDGPRYSEDYASFEAEVAEVRKKIKAGEDPLTFETGSVLNGIGDKDELARKFGVEIEVVFPDGDDYDNRHNLAQALHEAGLSKQSTIGEYHSGQETGWDGWTAERDTTVDLEIVSPLMSDTPEDWAQLQRVCDIIKAHGGEVNTQTGSHVHISTGDFGRSVPAHAAMLDEFSQYADILYRLGSNPETKTHRGTEWCAPNVVTGDYNVTNAGLINQKSISSISRYLEAPHSSAVNFEASGNGRKSHAEVRIWDGSIKPSVIQMQVMLTAAMTEVAAQRTSSIQDGAFTYSPDSAHTPLGSSLEKNFSSKKEETAKFREMLDRYFPKESDRKRFIALWETTKWQENTEEADDGDDYYDF